MTAPAPAALQPPPSPPAPAPSRLRGRLLEAAWVLAYLPLAVAFTWPLAREWRTSLAGNHGDAWQNLWNFVWFSRALGRGESPFATGDLWHPHGATLVFQTFDLPDAVLAAPLVGVLHPWAAYNLITIWVFVASGAAMYALGRGTGASRPASFLAGCAYTFSTYHFGHDLGHLHILAMQWVPLYVLALQRVLDGGRWRWAFAGGAFLACASLSSWYYLIGCFLVTLPIVAGALATDRLALVRRAWARALVLCATYLAIVGPLGVAMLRERAREPVAGAHPAAWFSADLESFVFPNAAQALARFSDRYERWTGNTAENATYLGALLVALVLVGLVLRAPRVASYVGAALVGIAISLGPRLHVGGEMVTGEVMPYVWAEKAFPLLEFMGVPVRFAFAATFGLAAALAPALDAIARRWSWKVAAPLAALAVLEHAPHAFITSRWPTPAPMLAWAKDTGDFAVLDATRDLRHLWHQTIHGHPIMGGYLTRTPARLERALERDPVAGPLWAWEPPGRSGPLRAEVLDFPFREPVLPGAEREHFSLELRGTLLVRTEGAYTFFVESDDGAELLVDGRRVVDNGGEHPPRESAGSVTLGAGEHAIAVKYSQLRGGALLRASWQGPGVPRRLLGSEDVPGGFTGTARFRRRELALSREAALAHLRSLRIRYIVLSAWDSSWPVEHQLGLAPVHAADGLRIYEVPPG